MSGCFSALGLANSQPAEGTNPAPFADLPAFSEPAQIAALCQGRARLRRVRLRQRVPVQQRLRAQLMAQGKDVVLSPAERPNQDRRVLPAEFQQIAAMLDRPFDLDACCNDSGDNALVEKYCSPSNSFLLHDCAGQHVWCNFPYGEVMPFLLHYLSCKARDPQHTSGVFVLPRWTGSDWYQLTRHMQVIKQYAPGHLLFDAPAPDGTRKGLPGIRWHVDVYYDPPMLPREFGKIFKAVGQMLAFRHDTHDQHAMMAAGPGAPMPPGDAVGLPCDCQCTSVLGCPEGGVSHGNPLPARLAAQLHGAAGKPTIYKRAPLRVTLRGMLAGVPANILFDSGADRCYIDAGFARRAGLTVNPGHVPVDLGNGTTVQSAGALDCVQLKLKSFAVRESFLVMPLQASFDVVLGTEFMDRYRCILNFDEQVVSCRKGERRFALSGEYPPPPPLHPRRVRFSLPGEECAGTSDGQQQPADVGTGSALLSALQVRRMMRKRANLRAYMVYVKEVPPDLADEIAAAVPCSRFRALLHRFRDVFQELPNKLPPDRGVGHSIPLVEGAVPPNIRQFRLSQAELKELESQVKMMLAKGWIRPSSSPYGAPVLFVPKPNGTWRMCIDYRALNKLTVKNKFPLPRIDDLLDRLSPAKVFTSIDLAMGYHQIRIPPEDVPKTAFRTHLGLYEFTVLTLGLTNAPATFQRVMNEMLAEEIEKGFVVVYLDDILIYSKTHDEHLAHVEAVLGKLRKNEFYARVPKCDFMKSELKYLGFVVGNGQLKPDPKKVQAVADWPTPKTKEEVRSLLGLTNYFRRFLLAYSGMCLPLTELLKNSAPAKLQWTPECEHAFQQLKHALTHAPVLQLPKLDEPCEVVADASKFALGAVLLQDGHPVAFESRKLTDAERNYHAGERELLAMVYALQKFRVYVLGQHFTLVTDHQPNTGLNSQASVASWSGRKARWAEFLQQYDFEFVHRAGRVNVADPLSRRPDLMALRAQIGMDPSVPACRLFAITRQRATAASASQMPSDASPPSEIPSAGRLRLEPHEEAMQTDDDGAGRSRPSIDLHRDFVRAFATDPEYLVKLANAGCVERDGLWWNNDLLVVPNDSQLRLRLLAELHDSPFAGHVGIARTKYNVARAKLWWPRWTLDIKEYVQSCHSCQRAKALNRNNEGKMQPLAVPDELWETITMDFITDLPLTQSGYDAIFVVVDKLSKMCHLIPTTKALDARECAFLLHREVISKHGFPVHYVSDRDKLFTSAFWEALAELGGVDLRRSTAYHPQTDGQTERVNRILEDVLRSYVRPTLDDWDRWLPCAEFAINNSYIERMDATPFYLNYGRHPRTPLHVRLMLDFPHLSKKSARMPRAITFAQTLQAEVQRVRKLLLAARDRMKAFADRSRAAVQLTVGQEVLLSTKNLEFKGPNCRKFLPRWIGPFQVKEMCGPAAVKLDLVPTVKTRIHDVFHVSLLKPYRQDAFPGRRVPPPMVVDLEGEEEFEVDRILDHRSSKSGKREKREFLIRWLGYGPEHDTWEPEASLENAPECLKDYWKYLGEKSQRKRRRIS